MYIQKLQKEWLDVRERTNIILDIEVFIYNLSIGNEEEIINLLESLLVEGQNDKSEKAITFTALKNLIPLNILCKDLDSGKSYKCYDTLVSKL
jgi:hypothetical protein